ncbi:hypothetical protein R3P38DRAFT_2808407 [Favolaschia claudopus]|uniref:Uncharacterized protein n=1 Tax=Favolaschia claudopus TaxID=2862362 RepID=A0AAV9ZGH3_9AGAR
MTDQNPSDLTVGFDQHESLISPSTLLTSSDFESWSSHFPSSPTSDATTAASGISPFYEHLDDATTSVVHIVSPALRRDPSYGQDLPPQQSPPLFSSFDDANTESFEVARPHTGLLPAYTADAWFSDACVPYAPDFEQKPLEISLPSVVEYARLVAECLPLDINNMMKIELGVSSLYPSSLERHDADPITNFSAELIPISSPSSGRHPDTPATAAFKFEPRHSECKLQFERIPEPWFERFKPSAEPFEPWPWLEPFEPKRLWHDQRSEYSGLEDDKILRAIDCTQCKVLPPVWLPGKLTRLGVLYPSRIVDLTLSTER